MAEESTKAGEAEFVTCGQMMKGMEGRSGASMCPMAGMFRDMTAKPSSGFLLMLPGLVLIVLGVLIAVEPRVLAWLAAVITILFGIALLMLATFLRRLAARFRSVHEQP
jgi:hypothetical protein